MTVCLWRRTGNFYLGLKQWHGNVPLAPQANLYGETLIGRKMVVGIATWWCFSDAATKGESVQKFVATFQKETEENRQGGNMTILILVQFPFCLSV